jgi:RNA polymerase sigma-70 factor (ECF subfamily)
VKISYKFVNGEANEIEVNDELGEVVLGLDRKEYNNNHKETRRHTSLDGMEYEGELFGKEDEEIAAVTAEEPIEERLKNAISTLKPDQQDLISAIYFDGVSVNEYAARMGIHQSAVSHRLQTIYRKLKKLI